MYPSCPSFSFSDSSKVNVMRFSALDGDSRVVKRKPIAGASVSTSFEASALAPSTAIISVVAENLKTPCFASTDTGCGINARNDCGELSASPRTGVVAKHPTTKRSRAAQQRDLLVAPQATSDCASTDAAKRYVMVHLQELPTSGRCKNVRLETVARIPAVPSVAEIISMMALRGRQSLCPAEVLL